MVVFGRFSGVDSVFVVLHRLALDGELAVFSVGTVEGVQPFRWIGMLHSLALGFLASPERKIGGCCISSLDIPNDPLAPYTYILCVLAALLFWGCHRHHIFWCCMMP